jgi:hypothetical protein
MDCRTCGHFELYKMITEGPYCYSGVIPCLRCSRYGKLDLHTSAKTYEVSPVQPTADGEIKSERGNKL